MKIYLSDGYTIKKYILPSKIEESFLLDYQKSNGHTFTITINSENGRWVIQSNGDINVLDGNNVIPSAVLIPYGVLFLRIVGEHNFLTIYSTELDEKTFSRFSLSKITSFTVGSGNSNIIYSSPLSSAIDAQITNENGKWIVNATQENKLGIYVNDIRINYKQLEVGDIIFVHGLKIIFMGEFVEVNNPNNLVRINGLYPYNNPVADNNEYVDISEDEENITLYTDEDYFYHSPRIIAKPTNKNIKIDAPPPNQIGEKVPFIIAYGTTIAMGFTSFLMLYTTITGIQDSDNHWTTFIPRILMSVMMLVTSLFLPLITKLFQDKYNKRREKLRQEKYGTYLDKKAQEIELELKSELTDLLNNNPDGTFCYNLAVNKGRELWSRTIDDDDFLTVRVGISEVNSKIKLESPEEKFSLDEDNLLNRVYELKTKSEKVQNAPITISFAKHNNMSLVFYSTNKRQYLDYIMTQVFTLNSPNYLKVVILTDSNNSYKWEYTKFLPHLLSEDKSMRFFSDNSNDLKVISAFLVEKLKERKELKIANDEAKKELKETEEKENELNVEKIDNRYRNYPPYYLIITDVYSQVKTSSIIEELSKLNVNYGFTFITIDDSTRKLPAGNKIFAEFGVNDGCILEREVAEDSQRKFQNDYLPILNMDLLASNLGKIPVMGKDGDEVLPQSITFMDMYKISRIEQLNILNRWKTNLPINSLSAPVGVHKNGDLFDLDLHEKYHGPHGLIAGTTGSGKSEFIITYILSMAINYDPREVQFVLIDYKGGGLAGAFENNETGVRLPHLAGTITNIDKSSINRALVSIKSELQRRQREFNKVKDKFGLSTVDIYKYQKMFRDGKIQDPMSHLFIISDEFAELKAQQPEFMDELISTARIGRSLGVHLVLATQKPSGVVNDQIWSNSKFKVCLKVQDRSDSMEMLKKPDAASIKEAGRFYLEVGYDDYYDIGQSGWSGAKYVPTERIAKKIDQGIDFVSNTLEINKSVDNEPIVKEEKEYGDQLTNIVKYIYSMGKKENLTSKQLWLNPISDIIYVDKIKEKYQYKPTQFVIEPIIGEYDNPKEQSQGLLNLRISNNNVLIMGQPGSGKENLLSTIIWSSIVEHSPSEVNYYIIDCGAELLKMFYKMPHIGNVANTDEEELIIGIFDKVFEEFNKRKEMFKDYGGTYQEYLNNSGKTLPLIVIIINGYDTFDETYNKMSENIQFMFRDCYKYGISFIITSIATNALRYRSQQYFETKVLMQLGDPMEYRSILDADRGFAPASIFGRGAIKINDNVVEFQTANIVDSKDRVKLLNDVSAQLNNYYSEKAPKVRILPEVVSLKDVKDSLTGLNSIPIGLSVKEKEIETFDFTYNKISTILSNKISEKVPFVLNIIKEIKSLNIGVDVIDFVGLIKEDGVINDNFNDYINNTMQKDIIENENNNIQKVYLVCGIAQAPKKLNEETLNNFNSYLSISNDYNNTYFILFDNYNSFKDLLINEWFGLIDKSTSIWLGDGIENQTLISTNGISDDDRNLEISYLAYCIEEGNITAIKCVIEE